MNKKIVGITAVLGGLAVVLGAFGAHALKQKLGIEELKNFETGVRYQMYHVLAILTLNNFVQISQKIKNRVAILFITGILFFSGSLYVLTAGGIDAKYIWFVTPMGGLFLIIGWLYFAWNLLTKKE